VALYEKRILWGMVEKYKKAMLSEQLRTRAEYAEFQGLSIIKLEPGNPVRMVDL